MLSRLRRDPRDHPDVDEAQPPVRQQEHIARMRVGVEEPFDEDLVEVGVEQRARERRTVDLQSRKR